MFSLSWKSKATAHARVFYFLYYIFIYCSISIISSLSVQAASPRHFLYTSSDDVAQDLTKLETLLKRPDIEGVQVIYSWKQLEKAKGCYDFSQIERDLQYLNRLKKKLFIQIQDRFFTWKARHVPPYLMQESVYQGGIVAQYDNPGENKPIGYGWVAIQWNAAVRQRYQKLFAALAEKFDGRILGVNLPETAIDIDIKRDKTGFSCDHYFQGTLENSEFVRKVFKKSYVVQYVNFWPCEWNNDHRYMSRFFAFAEQHRIGVGGPDIIPNKKAQMKNAYPFFNQYRGRLALVAMAIEEPTLSYTNPATQQPFTRDEFIHFAQHYLGVDIMFWSTHSAWLRTP